MLLSTGGSLTIFAGSNVVAGNVNIEGGALVGAGTLAVPVSSALGATFNVPNGGELLTLAGSVGISGSLVKTGQGALFVSNSGSRIQGASVLEDGAFPAPAVLAASGNVLFSGSGGYPTLDASGTFSESTGSGGGHVQWAGNGGFAAEGGRWPSPSTGGASLKWATASFVPAGSDLVLNSQEADNLVRFQNPIDLGGADRTVYVNHNPSSIVADYAQISGTISNSGPAAAGLVKDGPGTLLLSAANTYNGETTILDGALQAAFGTGIPASSFLVLDGGVLETIGSATFTRTLAASGSNSFEWAAGGGGFSAHGGKLTVNIGGQPTPAQLVSGAAPAGIGTNLVGPLLFGSSTADSQTLFLNPIDLAGSTQTVSVALNNVPGVTGDYATLAGAISNSGTAAAGLTKIGPGILELTGSNTYNGPTTILGGTIQAAALYNLGLGPDITFSGGGLRFTGVYDPSAGTMTFNAGGGTLDTGNQAAIVLANPVGNGGPGSLTKAGSGLLALLGNATYTGNTVVSAGSLQLGNGGGAGWILGDVSDNAVLVFNRSDSVTFPGAVSGSGGMAQVGRAC